MSLRRRRVGKPCIKLIAMELRPWAVESSGYLVMSPCPGPECTVERETGRYRCRKLARRRTSCSRYRPCCLSLTARLQLQDPGLRGRIGRRSCRLMTSRSTPR